MRNVLNAVVLVLCETVCLGGADQRHTTELDHPLVANWPKKADASG